MDCNNAVRLAVVLALLLAAGLAFYFLHGRDALPAALDQADRLGAWGPVILAAVYVPATVLAVPGTILSLAAGFAFGVVRGTIAVSVGSTLGACAAMLIGRYVARDWVERRMARTAEFAAIDRAVARQGFWIVLLVRLSPVFPFNVVNYLFGLTKIGLGRYTLASWLGMLPATVMYVYLGSAAKTLADLSKGDVAASPAARALFFAGLAAAVAAALLVARVAQTALRQEMAGSRQ